MSQKPCIICKHKEIDAINERIAKGESSRSIADLFGVNYKSVQRHALKCSREEPEIKSVPDVPKAAPSVKSKKRTSVEIVEEMKANLGIDDDDDESDTHGAMLDKYFEPVHDTTGWTLERHLAHARQIIYATFRTWDADTKLKAVDRLHKNIELEAKRTGQFTKDKENPDTIQKRKIVIENTVAKIMERDGSTREEATARLINLKPEIADWLN